MKKIYLFMLLLTTMFGCKKEKTEPTKITYNVKTNVADKVSYSFYEPNNKMQEFEPNKLNFNASKSQEFTYESGQSIVITAICKADFKDQPIELIITKTSTGEVIFNDKKIGDVRSSFTAK